MQNETPYFRLCPKCQTKKFYRTEYRLKIALGLNNQCKSCCMKRLHTENPTRMTGKNNPMFGKSCYSMWKETLTPQEAKMKIDKTNKLKSISHIGEKNAMFGKPSPNGSGRGRSGRWYNLHFRSLLELAFLELFFNTHKYLPISAEVGIYKIQLDNNKNYFADFIDKSGNFYEIKPMRLVNTPENTHKFLKARELLGDKFLVITDENLPNYRDIHLRLHQFNELIIN